MSEQKAERLPKDSPKASGRPDWPWYTYPAWYVAYIFIWLWAKLCFRFSYSYGPGVKDALNSEEPVVLLANHQSFIDPLFVLLALRARPVRFVVGEFLSQTAWLKGLMQALRAIPIHQFVADPAALRKILRALKNQERVLIFPEGQRSIDGSTCPFDKGILRVAAKAKASVVTIKLSGAYLAWPRWKQGMFRLGKVEARVEVLARAEDWPSCDQAGWQEKLQSLLAYNDHTWIKSRKTSFTSGGKLTGLDLILHACPVCGRAEVMRAQGWYLNCKACGASFQLNSNYQISSNQVSNQTSCSFSQDLSSWHHWQIQQEGKAWEQLKLSNVADYAGRNEQALPSPVHHSWLSWGEPGSELQPNSRLAKQISSPVQDQANLPFIHLIRVSYEKMGHTTQAEAGLRPSSWLGLTAQSCYLEIEDTFVRLPLRPGDLVMFSQGNYFQTKLGGDVIRVYPLNPLAVIRLVDLSFYLHKQPQN